MRFFKKWGVLLVSIFFIAVIAVLLVLTKTSSDKMKAEINDRDMQIATLKETLVNIGELSYGYVLNTDVRAGEVIKEDYFTEVSVPESLGLNIVKSVDGLEGAYFRTSLKESTVLTTEDIKEDEIVDSERYVDVIIDQPPVGVQAGDIIDIRITFPYGEDFIALSGKKIFEINNSIMKLRLNENEIQVYNSLLLDRVLYKGTQIWANTYVDAGSQETAEAFYPINNNASDLLLLNPNALELSRQEMVLKRQIVEETLGGGVSERTEEELENIEDQINDIREGTQDRIASANEVIEDRRQAEAERLAAEENGEVSSGGGGVSF